MCTVIDMAEYVQAKWPQSFRDRIAELAEEHNVGWTGFRDDARAVEQEPPVGANDLKTIDAVAKVIEWLPVLLKKRKEISTVLKRQMEKKHNVWLPNSAVILAALYEGFSVTRIGLTHKARIGC